MGFCQGNLLPEPIDPYVLIVYYDYIPSHS